jgi:RHS repeat-associated protein
LGKPLDATGLTQVGARYYEASIGRFISVDPVMDVSNPQQWAAYSYAENNPVTYSDPTGMLSQIDGQYSSGAASRRRVPWANWLRKGSPGRTVDVACTTSSWERCAGGATKRVPVTRRAPVMSLAVGISPEQIAYNEAWARSNAAEIIKTQTPRQQSAYAWSQGIDRILRPAVPLIAATTGSALAGRLPRPVDPLVEFANQNRSPGTRFAAEYTSPSGRKYYDVNAAREALPDGHPLNSTGHHGGCAEFGCLLQAYNAEGAGAIRGGQMRTVYVRGANSPIPPGPPRGHGAPATPCGPACQPLLGSLEVKWR